MVEAHLNGVRNAAAAGWRLLKKVAPLSTRSKKPSSSSKTTKPSTPAAAAF